MKYFEKGKGIIKFKEIFSLQKDHDRVFITEECDQYFTEDLPKEEASEMLQEAIEWLKGE